MSGHIRRRGERSWELRFELGARDPVTGKRNRRISSFKGTRREAELELARLVTQHAAGDGVDPTKSTVAEFAERWVRDWASMNLGAKSLERYRQVLRLNITPHIGHVSIQKLHATHVAGLYATLACDGGCRGGPLAPASIKYAHAVLKRMLGHAVVWGVITKNVAKAVSPTMASSDPEEITILSEEQIGVVLRHFNGHALRPIVSFLLGTGARRGEALALRWRDVDLDKGSVRIERSLEQTKAGLRIKAPKTKSGRRNVAISPWLVAELKAHRVRQNEQRLSLRLGRAADESPVFAQWDGTLEVPQRVTQTFARAMKALGIHCSLHGLRHTHVSQLIAEGVDVLTISRRIGHSKASITLDVYAHLFGDTDSKAAAVMEAVFARVRA